MRELLKGDLNADQLFLALRSLLVYAIENHFLLANGAKTKCTKVNPKKDTPNVGKCVGSFVRPNVSRMNALMSVGQCILVSEDPWGREKGCSPRICIASQLQLKVRCHKS